MRVSGPPGLRDALETQLQAHGIDVRAFYTRPMYEYDWWVASARQRPCPHAEQMVAGNLALPLFYGMKDPEIETMVAELSEQPGMPD
jgi:dTDP-4-amino-4,6-dideoxygalactose transaminase